MNRLRGYMLSRFAAFAAAIPFGIAAVVCLAPGLQASQAKATIYHPACQGDNPICGAVAYVNEGGYVVNPTKVDAKDSQPSGVQELSASCAGADEKYDADIDLGQYVVFVMPADCAYELKINIEAGNNKSRNIFLTPGCEYIAKTDGTTMSNDWHISVKWIDGKQPAGAPDHPTDKEGNKCGELGDM